MRKKANIPVWLIYSITVLAITLLVYMILIGRINLLGLWDIIAEKLPWG
jgi:hypothetical protein